MTSSTAKKRIFTKLRAKREHVQMLHKMKAKVKVGKALDEDMRVGFFIMALSTVFLMFFGFRLTHAFFSNAAASTSNTFSAALEFPTPTGNTGIGDTTPTGTPTVTPTPHLVINEVSSLGDSDVEWIEIFNPSSSPVDVSGWKIADASGISTDIFPSVSPIPANGFGVVVASGSAVLGSIPVAAITIQLTGTTIANGFNEGGDIARLLNPSDVIIDQMSYGTNTTVFPTPPAAPTTGQTTRRNPNGVDTDTATDWITDSSTSIGVSN